MNIMSLNSCGVGSNRKKGWIKHLCDTNGVNVCVVNNIWSQV